jgi:hypothetical protein
MRPFLLICALFTMAFMFGQCAGHWANDHVEPRYIGIEEAIQK